MNVLPSLYAGPISYYVLLINEENTIDSGENFQKQTYRNRCRIYGANGPLNLIIPITHKGQRTSVKGTIISNTENWQKRHWKSIKTAYQTSPYFEYYEDDLCDLFNKEYELLYTFNKEFLEKTIELLGVNCDIEFSEKYIDTTPNQTDFRSFFSDKIPPVMMSTPYMQVFEAKHGFKENLSILDLIFNLGPRSKEYLIGLKRT